MKVAPKHDFAAKLRQTPFQPQVVEYIRWQRAARKARELGTEMPPIPELSPLSINLDLTTACNYRCDHCIDWDNLNTGVNYAYDELLESLERLVRGGLRSVILIGGGEPTIHRKFGEVVRFLKERGIKIGVVTNGSRGDMLAQIAPVLSQGDWIRLSLDAGTNATFIAMHRPRHLALSLESICSWVPKIRAANPAVQVGFSFIITWGGAAGAGGADIVPNIDEIVMAAELAKQNEFSYISFKPFLTRFSDGSEVMDPGAATDPEGTLADICAAVAKAKELETPDFRVLESTNLRVLMEGNWRDFTRQPKTCHMMAFRQVLSPLGAFHCPAKRGVENARIAGNDAFTERRAIETREALGHMLQTFDAARECAEITCLYNATNWWLEGLVNEEGAIVDPAPDQGDYYL